jgi:hypothetical protein
MNIEKKVIELIEINTSRENTEKACDYVTINGYSLLSLTPSFEGDRIKLVGEMLLEEEGGESYSPVELT